MRFPKGSMVVFDKGYNDYGWHNQLTNHGNLLGDVNPG